MLFQPEERGCRDKKNALRVPALRLHYVKVSHIRSTIIVENLSGKQHRTKNFHLRDLGMCHRPDHREGIAPTDRGRGHNAGYGDVGGRPRGEACPTDSHRPAEKGQAGALRRVPAQGRRGFSCPVLDRASPGRNQTATNFDLINASTQISEQPLHYPETEILRFSLHRDTQLCALRRLLTFRGSLGVPARSVTGTDASCPLTCCHAPATRSVVRAPGLLLRFVHGPALGCRCRSRQHLYPQPSRTYHNSLPYLDLKAMTILPD